LVSITLEDELVERPDASVYTLELVGRLVE
jgi:hypothetical protein